MNHLKRNNLNKVETFKPTNKEVIMKMSSMDIVCASVEEEFFYEDSGQPVETGDPIGFDIEVGDEVELVLFSNIFWNPNY